ncbi:uncharacterized protein ACRADG_005157 isoform 2-T2 [Cochliomyia hominivorax]
MDELVIDFCRGSLDCPKAPVAPYPIISPSASNPVIAPFQTTSCSNSQTNFFQSLTTNPTNNFCCSTNQASQCSSTPSCNFSTKQYCGSIYSCCYQQDWCQTRSIQPCYQNCGVTCCNCQVTCLQTTTNEPDPIIKCPHGTKLIGNTCKLLYCTHGYEMVNDRCVVVKCPTGTVWKGYRCSVPEPVQHNVTFYNTIITQFNQAKQDITINNTNNILVNASLSLQNHCNNDFEDCDNTLPSMTTEPQQQPGAKCCEVMTPRICKNYNNRWRCYSRRSRRCGEFCVAPIIYLKPPRIYVRPPYVVMPPRQQDCQLVGNCNPITGGYDCSGCGIHDMERCSYYCYRYLCPSSRCNFYDQKIYCDSNGNSFGCKEEDGCYDNWCL